MRLGGILYHLCLKSGRLKFFYTCPHGDVVKNLSDLGEKEVDFVTLKILDQLVLEWDLARNYKFWN